MSQGPQGLAADIEHDVFGPGRDQLRQQATTSGHDDGAMPGAYKVLINPPPFEGAEGKAPPVVIDSSYRDPAATDLTAHVEAKPNKLTLTVRRPKGASGGS